MKCCFPKIWNLCLYNGSFEWSGTKKVTRLISCIVNVSQLDRSVTSYYGFPQTVVGMPAVLTHRYKKPHIKSNELVSLIPRDASDNSQVFSIPVQLNKFTLLHFERLIHENKQPIIFLLSFISLGGGHLNITWQGGGHFLRISTTCLGRKLHFNNLFRNNWMRKQ